ncbi:MAG: RHS repeat-associated core domain-containing protein [Nitrosomonadaceae bacterium]
MSKFILSFMGLIAYFAFGMTSLEAREVYAPDATPRAATVIENQLGFNCSYHDDESDLVYKRARYYSIDHGRFISADPAGMVDGPNIHAGHFAAAFGVDPSGLAWYLKLKNPDKSVPLTTWDWSDEHSWYNTVIGEGGIVQGAEVSLKIYLPEIEKACKYKSVEVSGKATSHYWHSPFFGTFMSHDKADYSASLTLACNQANGNLEVQDGSGDGTKGLAAYAGVTIDAKANGKSALVTISADAGVSATITSVTEFGIGIGGHEGAASASAKIGRSVTKTGGWGKTKMRIQRYTCEKCKTKKVTTTVTVPDNDLSVTNTCPE